MALPLTTQDQHTIVPIPAMSYLQGSFLPNKVPRDAKGVLVDCNHLLGQQDVEGVWRDGPANVQYGVCHDIYSNGTRQCWMSSSINLTPGLLQYLLLRHVFVVRDLISTLEAKHPAV